MRNTKFHSTGYEHLQYNTNKLLCDSICNGITNNGHILSKKTYDHLYDGLRSVQFLKNILIDEPKNNQKDRKIFEGIELCCHSYCRWHYVHHTIL